MSLNSVNIMGNLTRDPELKYTPAGKSVCSLSIANNRVFTKNGEKTQEVSYFDVEVWGVVGENCAKYLTKGSGVIVEGRLKQDRWEKDGKTQSRVRISANNVHFLAKKRDDANSGESNFRSGGSQPIAQSEVAENMPPAESIAWDE